MDQLAAMRVFVVVARRGSFAGAARQLRLSPSVVTRSIAGLEERLEQTILSRTTRSVRLTDRGKLYLERCEQILESVDEAERGLRGDAEPRGEMTIAAPVVFGRLHVLPIVARLLAAHPALAIRFALSDRNTHFVDDGIDVGVRIGHLDDSRLVALKVGAVTQVVVASPAYLRARGTPAKPAELGQHDLIAFENLDATNEWRFRGQPVRIAPRLTVNSADAAIAACEQGLGVARTLSYQVRASIEAGRLVPLLADHAPAMLPVSVVYPGRRIASVNVAAFVAAARAHFVNPAQLG